MSAKERVLQTLRKYARLGINDGWVSAVRLAQPDCGGLAARTRISDLRKEGYIIDSRRVEGKSYYEYRLIEEVMSNAENN